jgi:hypothetical protein
VTEELLKAPDPVLYLDVFTGPTIALEFGISLKDAPEDWLPTLPAEYRGRDVRLTTLGEARKLQEPAFIKPPNDKSFPARTYLGSELPLEFADTTPVLVQGVVSWEKEFRCFILDRTVKTFSIYLRDGVLQEPASYESHESEDVEMLEFADRVLADERVSLPSATVMDVGLIRDRGWAIVELNGAWASGIYGCDPIAALEVIQRANERMPSGN